MQIRTFAAGPMGNNMYLIEPDDDSGSILVDACLGGESVVRQVQGAGTRVKLLVLTHAHLDHVAATALAAETFGCPVAMHDGDAPLLQALAEQAAWFGLPTPPAFQVSQTLSHNTELPVGGESVRVLHTPGHSPGHVCLLGDGWAIVGDLVFAGSIGRADLPGGDMKTLMASIRDHILTLPDNTVLYPGHGPSTTVGVERRTNPFLVNGGFSWS